MLPESPRAKPGVSDNYNLERLQRRVGGVGDVHPGVQARAQVVDDRVVEPFAGDHRRYAGRIRSYLFGADPAAGLLGGYRLDIAEERLARQLDALEFDLFRRRQPDLRRRLEVVGGLAPAPQRVEQ